MSKSKPDWVIEVEAIGGPCYVNQSIDGDPGRTHNLEQAERFATENEARENRDAIARKYPQRHFTISPVPDERSITQALHLFLEARWKKAGSPVHATEMCLWDMQRLVDDNDPARSYPAVIEEGVELLERWIECGSAAQPNEAKAIAIAKAFLSNSPASAPAPRG